MLIIQLGYVIKRKKLNIFELKETDEKTLSKLGRETLEEFTVLKNIYDNNFLNELIAKRFHYDNFLLWLLSSKEPYAKNVLADISKQLVLLKDSDSVKHFKNKLRSTSEPILKSYLTELEMAAYYKERGYDVELEPATDETGKKSEFKIASGDFKVYFEAKNIFWEEIAQMNKIETQIHGALWKTKEKYVFSIYYTPKFKIGDIPFLKRFVIQKLRAIRNGQKLPAKLFFINETDLRAEINVLSKPNIRPYGYLGTLMRSEAFSIPGGKEIRRKISQKVAQLPKNEACVIVIERAQMFIHEEDVLDALYGDENVVINLRDNSSRLVRKHNGTFSPRFNRRLSAVVFFEKKWNEQYQNFTRLRVVFHNPFARKKLSTEFFDDVNVRQFVPVEEEHSVRMMWKQ